MIIKNIVLERNNLVYCYTFLFKTDLVIVFLIISDYNACSVLNEKVIKIFFLLI